MFKELFKSFIIGSSIPAFIIFFIGVTHFIKYEKSAIFDYHMYSILAPIGLGFASLFAKYIHITYNIDLKKINNQIENPAQFNQIKKNIARLFTNLNTEKK